METAPEKFSLLGIDVFVIVAFFATVIGVGLWKSRNERDSESYFLAGRGLSWWLIGSFVLSAILNYVLAMWIVQSPSGTYAWNDEVGKMTALSWPVIAIPSMAMMMVVLMKLVKGIETCTGHGMEEILHPDMREKVAEKTDPEK